MGGLFSCCCGEEEEAGGDAGERTRLIRWRHTFVLFGPLSFFRTGDKLTQSMLGSLERMIGLKFPTFNLTPSVMVLDMEGRWCRMGCIVKEETDLEGLHRCL